MKVKNITISAVLSSLLLFSGCGGGSDSSKENNNSVVVDKDKKDQTTSESQYLDKVPNTKAERTSLFSKRAYEFAEQNKKTQEQCLKTFSDLSEDFTLDLEETNLTQDKIDKYYENIDKLVKISSANLLSAYNLNQLSQDINIHKAGYQKRFLLTTITVVGIGLSAAGLFKFGMDAHGKKIDLAVESIGNMDKKDLPKVAESLGMDKNSSREKIMNHFVNLPWTKKSAKAKTIVDIKKDIEFERGETKTAEKEKKDIVKTVKDSGKVAVTTVVGLATAATGGQGVDKLATWAASSMGASAQTATLVGATVDLGVSKMGGQALDHVARLTTIQSSKETKTETIPPANTTKEKAVDTIENLSNKGDGNFTKQQVDNSVNKLKEELVKGNTGVEKNSDGSTTVKVPKFVSISNTKGNKVKVANIGESNITTIVDKKTVNVAENVDTSSYGELSVAIEELSDTIDDINGIIKDDDNLSEMTKTSIKYSIYDKKLYKIYYKVQISTDTPNNTITVSGDNNSSTFNTKADGTYTASFELGKSDKTISFDNKTTGNKGSITLKGTDAVYPDIIGTWTATSTSTSEDCWASAGRKYSFSIHKNGKLSIGGANIGSHNNYAVSGGIEGGRFSGSFSSGRWTYSSDSKCFSRYRGSYHLKL